MSDDVQVRLREALKLVAVALKEGGVPFALAGGYALWARGGPEPDHDVDFVVAEADAPRAAELLADEGFDVVQPPEDWLFKVYVDHALVDVLFRTAGEPVPPDRLAAVDQIEVESVRMPVLSTTELMVDKLNALEEHACDFGKVVPVARAVREQVDWDEVAARTADNDFAAAMLFLLTRLGIVEAGAPGVGDPRVRGTL
ncbi:nucleotidyltransferase family protein [Nocardioides sp.]|uniref:nucleotidyltransferase family protein n=1 Tax=Nocardioides sp. TaxID=35761 RepID=UPI002ED806C2